MNDDVKELIARCRLLEIDHEPHGWPAIRMKDVSALCDEIERMTTPIFQIGEVVRVDRFDGNWWTGKIEVISEVEYSISLDATNNDKIRIWFPESQIYKL